MTPPPQNTPAASPGELLPYADLSKSKVFIVELKQPNEPGVMIRNTQFSIDMEHPPKDTFYVYRHTNTYSFYTPTQTLHRSPWKGMKSYLPSKPLHHFGENANTNEFFRMLEHTPEAPKTLEKMGISLRFWYNNDLGKKPYRMNIDFYLDQKKVFNKVEDAYDKFEEIFRNRIQVVMTMLVTGKRLAFDLADFYPDRESYQATLNKTDFTRFFGYFNMYKQKHAEEIPMYSLRSDQLNCQLMPYQKDTIRWMIHREISERDEEPLWNETVRIENYTNLYYYPHLGVVTRTKTYWNCNTMFMERFRLRGGILADEMGLGKTVQVLSLIAARKRGDRIEINREESPERVGDHENMVNESIAEQVRIAEKSHAEMTTAKYHSSQLLFAADEYTQDPVDCSVCDLTCSASVCGWTFPEDEIFVCPSCWTKSGKRKEIGTTLIILPETLIFQWFTEVAKHCSDSLNVMFYFGIKKHGYLQPSQMNKYDVILTTYDTIKSETDFSMEQGPRRKLRNEFQPHYLTSSLIHVKFWRVIVDEAQVMPTGNTGKLSNMLLKIHGDNWWSVTGTPLVRSLGDLVSTFHFLDLHPFCYPDYFQFYLIPQYLQLVANAASNQDLPPNFLLDTLGKIMSRKTKEDVRDQMGLPKLVEIEKKIFFTAIEERQYKEEKERLKNIVAKTLGNHPSDTYLRDLSCREKVLHDLGVLRETILTGLNNGRQEAGSANYVYAPETVIFRLMHLKKMQVKKCFREFMAGQLGLAGTYLLTDTPEQKLNALEAYKKALECYDEIKAAETYIEKTIGIEDMQKVTGRLLGDEMIDVRIEDEAGRELTTSSKVSFLLKSMIQGRRKYVEVKEEGSENSSDSPSISGDSGDSEGPSTSSRTSETSETSDEAPKPKKPKVEKRDQKEEKLNAELAVEIEEELKEQEQDEKERIAYSQRLAAIALRPMKMDGTQEVHLILNKRKLQEKMIEMGEVAEGEMEMVSTDGLEMVYQDYYKVELVCVRSIREETAAWSKIWDQYQMMPLRDFFKTWSASYTGQETTRFLIGENNQIKYDFLKSVIPFLPFNPLFNPLHPTKDIKHLQNSCMGACHGILEPKSFLFNRKPISVFPIDEVIEKTMDHLEMINTKRIEVEDEFEKLIELLVEMGDSSNISSLLNQNDPDPHATDKHRKMYYTLACNHDVINGLLEEKGKVLINDTEEILCQLCLAHTLLCSLKFDAGYTSFHGNLRSKSGVQELISYLIHHLSQGQRKMKFIINPFFSRLHDFTRAYSNATLICLELLNRFKELQQAKTLMTLEQIMKNSAQMQIPEGEDRLAWYARQCQTDAHDAMLATRKQLHEVRYLTNLVKEQIDGRAKQEECPICQLEMESFLVFTCGHRICQDCWDRLKKMNKRDNPLQEDKIKCPTCRVVNKMKQVMIAKNGYTEQSIIPGMILSAKMTNAITLMKEIINEDDSNKIILFTNIDPSSYTVWRYLQKILKLSQLPYTVMVRASTGKKIVDFEVSEDKKILLCSLSMCANGLNMTGANHIIFLDPPHLRSVLLQAIGRINRFGQKREMKVHHLIVDGSLDVELRQTAKEHGEQSVIERRGWTCGDIRDMFDINIFQNPTRDVGIQNNAADIIIRRF